MPRSPLPIPSRRRRFGLAALAVVLVSGLSAACAPQTKNTSLPVDIEQMSDAQVAAQLVTLAPKIQAAYQDPTVLASIPSDKKPAVLALVR